MAVSKGLAGAAAVILASVYLAGCTSSTQSMTSTTKRSKEYFSETEYGVKASPRVTNKRTRLPRGGGRDQIGKPYKVAGKVYYPREEKNYAKTGSASWYGDAFHGRLTANGEIYDMTHLTAAHPTMPLPSYARVTNMNNGSSVIVRVNDRGPFHSNRVIDLSKRAAEMLDYHHAGVARVKVEYIGRAPLHGQDDEYLMASYKPGRSSSPDPSDGLPAGVMIAMNGPTPSQGGASSFPGMLSTTETSVSATSQIALDLPALGPIGPERPATGIVLPEMQIAMASMSYAPVEKGAAGAFAAMEGDAAGWKQAMGVYVAVGTYRTAAEAEIFAKALAGFGTIEIDTDQVDGRTWHTVVLRTNGSHSTDEMLTAAWRSGATEAMTVRD